MNAVVIGYGSIGARHARVLDSMGLHVGVVSRRDIEGVLAYKSLKEALDQEVPDYAVVSNQTDQHYDTLRELISFGFAGKVLVEKPLFNTPHNVELLKSSNIFVGYNLRYHPVLQKMKQVMSGERALSVTIYVGQYLPTWRQDSDYRMSYSSDSRQGGGVLRDLSHEIDYVSWLFGGWTAVTALGGHFSSLEITSDDQYSILGSTEMCPIVTMQLNYLDRCSRRQILVNTDAHTIEADLVAGTLKIDDALEQFTVSRDYTFEALHHAILYDATGDTCTFEQGNDVIKTISAIETAAHEMRWVTL